MDHARVMDRVHQRQLADRRRRPTPMLTRYWLRGRRRGGRRTGEVSSIYVDRYTALETGLFVSLLLLSGLDLWLTAVHMDAGGAEANPVMAWVMAASGPAGFAVAKILATSVGAMFLLVHVRFGPVSRILALLVTGYLCLMLWHGLVAFDRVTAWR